MAILTHCNSRAVINDPKLLIWSACGMGIHKHGSFTFKADHIYIYTFFVLCYPELPPPPTKLKFRRSNKKSLSWRRQASPVGSKYGEVGRLKFIFCLDNLMKKLLSSLEPPPCASNNDIFCNAISLTLVMVVVVGLHPFADFCLLSKLGCRNLSQMKIWLLHYYLICLKRRRLSAFANKKIK